MECVVTVTFMLEVVLVPAANAERPLWCSDSLAARMGLRCAAGHRECLDLSFLEARSTRAVCSGSGVTERRHWSRL